MSNGSKSNNPHWGWGLTILFYYLLFLLPSLYALVALTEPDFLMEHGYRMYSDYGRNGGVVTLTIGFTAIYVLSIIFGTIVTTRVFKREWGIRWLGILAAIANFIMPPVAIGFLLGVGHS